MGNSMSFLKPKSSLGSLHSEFENVVCRYFDHLCDIAYVISNELIEDINKEKRHFSTIKNEFSKFLYEHKKCYQLKSIKVMSGEDLVLNTFEINYENSLHQMFKLEDLNAFCNEIFTYKTVRTTHYDIEVTKKQILKRIRATKGKLIIRKKDVEKFIDKYYLAEDYDSDRKCLNYKELQADINSRVEKYHEEFLNFCPVRNDFHDVVNAYISFLLSIGSTITEGSSDEKRERRKFKAVKKELFEFLVDHKNYFDLSPIYVKSEGSFVFSLNINNLDNFEMFLKLEDFLRVFKIQPDTKTYTEMYCSIYLREKEIISKLKGKLGKSTFTNIDILLFSANNFLVGKERIKSKCCNYKQLKAHIANRKDSYVKEEIDPKQIDHLSFRLQGLTSEFIDEKSCGVCLEDYEVGQEVCRLPCNHFCCRACTEQMFAIPDDGSKANFQCPICRDDCT